MTIPFFRIPELETLYALTQLSMEDRLRTLNVTQEHLTSPQEANHWLSKVIEQLHVCGLTSDESILALLPTAYDALYFTWLKLTNKSMDEYPYPTTVSWYRPETSYTLPTIPREPIGDFLRTYYPNCDSINLVSEVPQWSGEFVRDIIVEFSLAQTGGSGRGIDIFPVLAIPEDEPELFYNKTVAKTVFWRMVASEAEADMNGDSLDIINTSFVGSVESIEKSVQERGYTLRRLLVVDLTDIEYPINEVTWLTNYVNATSPSTFVVVLTKEQIPFNGAVVVM